MLKKLHGEKIFSVFNYILLGLMSLICILPMIHVLAISFSSKTAASAGEVSIWPVQFTTLAYDYVLKRPEFGRALFVSVERVLFGLIINIILIILTAYPLSKENKIFRLRGVFVWYFVLTMLFSGGLIPTYMTVKATGLINSVWSLILPGAVPIFNVLLLLNFFRGIPKEIEESSLIDGANQWMILFKMYVPLSIPALATIVLFTAVGHWNSWFDGLIYMNRSEKYPLQSYLQTVVVAGTMTPGSFVDQNDWKILNTVSDRTAKAAQIFVGALPIVILYPFLQKYFMKGIVLGSVKG
jgi:ABC-type sugar transport system, permease component